MHEDGSDDARLRLCREVADTRQRVALGGWFYLAGWVVVSSVAPVYPRHAALGIGLSLAFLALAALRVLVKAPPPTAAPARQQRWINRVWAVVLASAALWGGVMTWVVLDPAMVPALSIGLLCSIAYATAYAHNFSMRRSRALLGIVLIYLPAPALLASQPGQGAVSLTLSVYFIYVVLILYRSHSEYLHRLDLDEQLRHQRDQYERLSRTDALTGLANRRHFSAELERLSADAQRGLGTMSLLVLDLDHFKHLNDEHGHDAGDACLARFAERMREVFQAPDAHLARLGGEEFAVLLPDMAPAAAAALAERMRASLAQRPLQLREGPIALTVSIGVAGRVAGQEGADLYRAADRAMYQAKGEGRDRVRIDGT